MLVRTIGLFSASFLVVSTAFSQDFSSVDDGSKIAISDHGQAVLTYVYKAPAPKEGESADPAAPNNYFHPVYGLYGEVITGDSPSNWSGAPGIHWGWTRLGSEDGIVDLEQGRGGKRLFERILGAEESKAGFTVGIQNVWVAGEAEHAQAIENIIFTVSRVEQAKRTIDISVMVRSVATKLIYLEGSIPGSGLTLTLNPELDEWGFAGAQGGFEAGSPPFLSPWLVCSYRDARRSSRSGIAVMLDSRNPGYAQPNLLIESDQRVIAGAPDSVKSELRPGAFLEFHYRLILHHGNGSRFDMTTAYSNFMAEVQQRE